MESFPPFLFVFSAVAFAFNTNEQTDGPTEKAGEADGRQEAAPFSFANQTAHFVPRLLAVSNTFALPFSSSRPHLPAKRNHATAAEAKRMRTEKCGAQRGKKLSGKVYAGLSQVEANLVKPTHLSDEVSPTLVVFSQLAA